MNVFGVGGWELILIGVLAILVLGPERMARYAFQAGRWMRRFSVIWQDSVGTLREQLSDELDLDITEEDIALLRNLRNLDIQKQLGLKEEELAPSENGGRARTFEAWTSEASPARETAAAREAESAPDKPAGTHKVYSAWTPPTPTGGAKPDA